LTAERLSPGLHTAVATMQQPAVLSVPQITIHDSFFSGAQSFLARQIVSSAELPLRSLFAAPAGGFLPELVESQGERPL
jgi:hypothetical protein